MSLSIPEQAPFNEADRSVGAFWHKYGPISGLSPEQTELLTKNTQQHYDPELEQHNFDHALDTAWHIMELADEYEAEHGPTPRKLLIIAAFYHDAGYHKDHRKEGFKNKEEFSAYLFEQDDPQNSYGLDEDEIFTTKKFITSTNADFEPENNFQVLMQRGDLSNVEGNSYTFLATTRRIVLETAKRKKKIPEGKVALDCLATLLNFYKHNLDLPIKSSKAGLKMARTNINLLAKRLANESAICGVSMSKLGKEAVDHALADPTDEELTA